MSSLSLPQAEGRPLDPHVAREAAEWLTRLMAEDVTEELRCAWQGWLQASPDHARAWRHIEAVTGRFRSLAPAGAYRVLSPYAQAESLPCPVRRELLSLLGLLSLGAGVGAGLSLLQGLHGDTVCLHAGVGQRRTETLADGTLVTLNSRTRLRVDFSGSLRRLQLLEGELWIETAAGAADPRPFLVVTEEGWVRALGTRFLVRQESRQTHVAVMQSAVEAWPREQERPLRLQAGEGALFSRQQAVRLGDVPTEVPDWVQGQIVADDQALGDFLRVLSRHRPGLLRWDPAVESLRLSGVFPLHDTDLVLATLPSVLPVAVRWRTRFWVSVDAR